MTSWPRIYATLQADGTLDVTEDRTYDINGEYHGVYWDLSRDGGEDGGLAITVRSCGIVSGSDYSTFEQNDSNSDGTYTVSSGEYAELRVTMPSSWLLDMNAVDEERLDTILQEEKGWAEETNARGASACASASVARSAPAGRA